MRLSLIIWLIAASSNWSPKDKCKPGTISAQNVTRKEIGKKVCEMKSQGKQGHTIKGVLHWHIEVPGLADDGNSQVACMCTLK